MAVSSTSSSGISSKGIEVGCKQSSEMVVVVSGWGSDANSKVLIEPAATPLDGCEYAAEMLKSACD